MLRGGVESHRVTLAESRVSVSDFLGVVDLCMSLHRAESTKLRLDAAARLTTLFHTQQVAPGQFAVVLWTDAGHPSVHRPRKN